MIVGDPELRSSAGGQRQLCHRCEANIQQNPFGGAPCTGTDTFALPSGTCGGGIRATITFPTYVLTMPCLHKPELSDMDHVFLGAGTE